MADPVVEAALTLISAGALQGFGGEAGKEAWSGLGRLAALIRGKLGHREHACAALDRVEHGTAQQGDLQLLAKALHDNITHDPDFLRQLTLLTQQARANGQGAHFVTKATENASVGKIVNIDHVGGDVCF